MLVAVSRVTLSDVTSTSFGYIIGFLLPGLVGLYGLGYWSAGIRSLLLKPGIDTEATVGPSLLVLLAALAVGLLVNGFRSLIFDKWLCKKYAYETDFFSKLGTGEKLNCFRAFADELFRYHQFFGGFFIAFVPMYLGWLWTNKSHLSNVWLGVSFLGFTLLEWFAAERAIDMYRKFVQRSNLLVKGR